jgi:hypothetical protein
MDDIYITIDDDQTASTIDIALQALHKLNLKLNTGKTTVWHHTITEKPTH